MPILGVNIDHVATLRQARRGAEPDPVRAAHEAELGGADCITVHLREDRRHIVDDDVARLRPFVNVKLNLEMAATDEMVRIARQVRPHMATLVPEGRQEITTEGGLDVAGQTERMKDVVAALKDAGMTVSAFIEHDARQIEASAACGFDACEIHTGPYAHAFAAAGGDFLHEGLRRQRDAVADGGIRIMKAGMRFHAGHGLNYHNVGPVASMEGLAELHIGHAIVSRAVYVGLRSAVREMVGAIAAGRA
ncbi:MAG: pyridoxine 5'-phosphate synthase [Planctomycetota bacterium]|nr:MAG: pyridoxine 5'-phosphate synthase [Planctomycetota bacterium]